MQQKDEIDQINIKAESFPLLSHLLQNTPFPSPFCFLSALFSVSESENKYIFRPPTHTHTKVLLLLTYLLYVTNPIAFPLLKLKLLISFDIFEIFHIFQPCHWRQGMMELPAFSIEGGAPSIQPASKSRIKLAHKLNRQNQRLANAFKNIQNISHKYFLTGLQSSPLSTQTISIAAASATLLQRRLS